MPIPTLTQTRKLQPFLHGISKRAPDAVGPTFMCHQLMLPVRPHVQLAHTIQVHDPATVDAAEAVLSQPALDAGHGLAHQVHARAGVQSHVVRPPQGPGGLWWDKRRGTSAPDGVVKPPFSDEPQRGWDEQTSIFASRDGQKKSFSTNGQGLPSKGNTSPLGPLFPGEQTNL